MIMILIYRAIARGLGRRDIERLPVDHRPVGMLAHRQGRTLALDRRRPRADLPSLRVGMRHARPQSRHAERKRSRSAKRGAGIQEKLFPGHPLQSIKKR
jgi:hypothetical protein